jgi:glycosyltransferase involved in cell wall biosynthesis
VIDAHNSGIYPFENKSRLLRSISCWLQRNAALTIVTNKTLKDFVEKNGGTAFVLPDAIPSTPNNLKRKKLKGDINLTCICTFNEDEPYWEIIKAARLLSTDIHIYFTGKFEGKISSKEVPDNVHLTGFIPESEYWDLLYSSDIIIDLTLREDCLVCGAYEGIALEKPLILSNTNALKEYFSKGSIYADPFEKDIYKAIQASIQDMENLQKDIKLLKVELEESWLEKISQLKNKINTLDL